MLHAGLDLSRRRLDVCLVDDAGELVAQTAAAPDADGLRHLVMRVGAGRVRAVIESMNGARFVHDALEEPSEVCHVNAATCQNSGEIPQIADEFRPCGLPFSHRSSLQNGHIQALGALDRTHDAAGSSSATSGRPVARCSRSGPARAPGGEPHRQPHVTPQAARRHESSTDPAAGRSTRQMTAKCGKSRTAARSCEGWPALECRNHAIGALRRRLVLPPPSRERSTLALSAPLRGSRFGPTLPTAVLDGRFAVRR